MRRSFALLTLAVVSATTLSAQAPADTALAARIKERYTKREVRIRVRDGAQLFTSIYVPRDTSEMNFKPLTVSGVTFSAAQQAAAFEAYILANGITKSSEPAPKSTGF